MSEVVVSYPRLSKVSSFVLRVIPETRIPSPEFGELSFWLQEISKNALGVQACKPNFESIECR